MWASGRYSFEDTIEYRFSNLERSPEAAFRLYLPLYNSVKWLAIGVPGGTSFALTPKSKKEKPVVIYGTSIAQGGCASRLEFGMDEYS